MGHVAWNKSYDDDDDNDSGQERRDDNGSAGQRVMGQVGQQIWVGQYPWPVDPWFRFFQTL